MSVRVGLHFQAPGEEPRVLHVQPVARILQQPPPYKDFAKELAEEMARERVDVRRNGKRETSRTYRVRGAAMVALSEEKRKRA